MICSDYAAKFLAFLCCQNNHVEGEQTQGIYHKFSLKGLLLVHNS